MGAIVEGQRRLPPLLHFGLAHSNSQQIPDDRQPDGEGPRLRHLVGVSLYCRPLVRVDGPYLSQQSRLAQAALPIDRITRHASPMSISSPSDSSSEYSELLPDYRLGPHLRPQLMSRRTSSLPVKATSSCVSVWARSLAASCAEHSNSAVGCGIASVQRRVSRVDAIDRVAPRRRLLSVGRSSRKRHATLHRRDAAIAYLHHLEEDPWP